MEENEADRTYHFVVRLPPLSGFYSFDPNFFNLMGLSMSLRQSTFEDEPVYGFFNDSPAEGDRFIGKAVLMAGRVGYKTATGAADVDVPSMVRFRVYRQPIMAQATASQEVRGTVYNVVSQVNEVLLKCHALLRLKEPLVTAEMVDGGRAISLVSSVLSAITRHVLILEFDEETSSFLRIYHESKIPLSLNQANTVTMMPADDRNDPLSSYYPLTLITEGSGEGYSHIEGLGYQPVFGLIDRSGRVTASPRIYRVDGAMIRLNCLDGFFRPVVFTDSFSVFMVVELKPLKRLQGQVDRKAN